MKSGYTPISLGSSNLYDRKQVIGTLKLKAALKALMDSLEFYGKFRWRESTTLYLQR